jgi:hypothetical protein
MSDVSCGGNLPANCKGCAVYKDLQKKAHRPIRLKQYTFPTQIKHTLYTELGITHAQINKQNSYTPTNVMQEPLTNQPLQPTGDTQDLKNTMKSLSEQWELG